MITNNAPNFAGTYPLAAERLGPAWRETWRVLAASPRTWHRGHELAERVAPRHGLTVQAVSSLLADAARYGLLERRYVRDGNPRRRRALYRLR